MVLFGQIKAAPHLRANGVSEVCDAGSHLTTPVLVCCFTFVRAEYPDMLSMVRNVMAFSWLMIFVLCLATLFLAASYVRAASVEGLR